MVWLDYFIRIHQGYSTNTGATVTMHTSVSITTYNKTKYPNKAQQSLNKKSQQTRRHISSFMLPACNANIACANDTAVFRQIHLYLYAQVFPYQTIMNWIFLSGKWCQILPMFLLNIDSTFCKSARLSIGPVLWRLLPRCCRIVCKEAMVLIAENIKKRMFQAN